MGWILITGAAKGLGATTARVLAQQGYDVVIHYCQSEREAEKTANECRQFGVQAEIFQGDFSNSEKTCDFIGRYTAKYVNTYALVNNVGNYFGKEDPTISSEQIEQLFQTNVHAPYAFMKELYPILEQTKGNVVNIGMAGLELSRADIYCPLYTTTKRALYSLTRACAKKWAPHGVRANMVSPGYIDTAVDLPITLTDLPLKRAATENEVARVIAFLIDPKSAYITGQNIEVAGGVRL